MLRSLRTASGPQARIDFVVKKEFAELVRYNHHLSVVHELDTDGGFASLQNLTVALRAEHYDLVVDLHDNLRTTYMRNFCGTREVVSVDKRHYERWQLVHLKRNIYEERIHVVDRYIEPLREFGVVNDGKGLELFIPDEIQFAISSKMAKLRLNEYNKVIGVCPGARHFTKRWQSRKFAEVSAALAKELHTKVLVFGGADDRAECAEIASAVNANVSATTATDLSGSLSLLEVAAAMDYCDMIITNDTGLMHIACARQKKVVAIFGSTVQEFGFAPYGTDSKVMEVTSLGCRPCSHIGRAECPKGHFKCMGDIGVEEVRAAAVNLLGR